MTIRARSNGFVIMSLAVLLAACGGEGGELREATERRRAQQAELDTVGDSASAARREGDDGFQVPPFVQGDSAAPAAPDSAPAEPADTTPPAPPPSAEWTAGVREVGRPRAEVGVLRGLRVARNDGFDRVVMEFAGGQVPGWRVEYVDRPVRQCGSGEEVEVAGDAWLHIRLTPAQAHDDAGNATLQQRERRYNLPLVRELEIVCDFEGQVEIVLGLSAPNEFRVTEVPSPARLVVDVRQ